MHGRGVKIIHLRNSIPHRSSQDSESQTQRARLKKNGLGSPKISSTCSKSITITLAQTVKKIENILNFNIFSQPSIDNLLAAIIVSCVLAGIMGIVFEIGLVFAINYTYRWVLNHISNVSKYSTFEKGCGGEIDE